nr:MAG TPA: hypothetical protein [Caudoviricetes sp.]
MLSVAFPFLTNLKTDQKVWFGYLRLAIPTHWLCLHFRKHSHRNVSFLHPFIVICDPSGLACYHNKTISHLRLTTYR